ncbi:MAG: hypothetical protein L6Q57_05965 [Alphaproteobacteria bacterium]|nr:hypothetical protein [Alphaproteobacteria bacterium]
MRKVLLAIIFLLCVICTGPLQAAQDLQVRASEHTDYSRLVFEGAGVGSAKIETPQKGQSSITFGTQAELAATVLKNFKANNLSAISILKAAPLTVLIQYAPQSRMRHFITGNRLVVDIYAAPGGTKTGDQPKQKPSALPPLPKQAPSENPKERAEGKPEKEKQAVAQAQTKQNLPEAAVTAPVVKPPDVKAEEIKTPEPVPALQRKERVGNNAVMLAATEQIPLAAYVEGDTLNIAVGKNNLIIAPKIEGPSASRIGPFRSATLADGLLFTGAFPPAALRTQGGGLVWRVLVTDEESTRADAVPILPQRVKDEASHDALLWPLKAPRGIMRIPDAFTGKDLIVVTTDVSKDVAGDPLEFVDFSTLRSLAGLIIRPRVDDLRVEITTRGILITRPQGLNLLPQNLMDMIISNRQTQARAQESKAADAATGGGYIYNFMGWQMGGPKEMRRNRNIILPSLAREDAPGAVQGLLTLAKMYLSNGFWAEAKGMLEYALIALPELKDNPEFLALLGASEVLGYQSEAAFAVLSSDLLKPYTEVHFWRAFALGDLGDWKQAELVMPADVKMLERYPPVILGRLGPMLAEIALRAGKRDAAEIILGLIEKQSDSLLPPQKAAVDYLRGELARQNKQLEETERIWSSLQKGQDELYRTKAGLALARLHTEQGKLDARQTIDRLERLRYSWRGDELEAQVNYWLGRTYFDQGQYSRGLNIMREAAIFAGSTNLAQRIATEMRDSFIDLFLSDKLKAIPAVDAAAIYEDFAELAPPGATNDQIMQRLAERMVDGDLLGKAATLMKKLVDHRLQGVKALQTGTRLAAIQLLDNKPQDALITLDKMDRLQAGLAEAEKTPAQLEELFLLRARALSQQGQPQEAVTLLRDKPRSRNTSRLQADIAWRAGYWDDAAEALEEVVADQNISLTRPLSNESAALLMNWALAMNLAGDRVGLANMRERYSDAMAQTDKSRVFDVITRPRQSATLADRERMLSIVSEVDLFSDFLDNYRNVRAP